MPGAAICPSCASENEGGRKFCGECGAPLTRACESCGTANAPGMKFCGECGGRLDGELASPAAPPAAERRLVSVLFADLVGFTAASEDRDAEETRELLSRYFDTCRTLIERYGGTVEKFIGDAVMAVWGTPVAREDDAERAVRAALELLAGVSELDTALQARAAVLSGEAAVTLGAEGQGMVAGDLVNSASRIQSVAEPGSVLVGEVTRRASEAAIAYESAGSHELKGKAEAVPVWRALRVIAARRGALRSDALEPPFVGRDRELRLVKELFHGSAEEGRAHLASVIGIAGIGKSRLSWEFEKYLDGLIDDVFWWRGRCLAYGEGVAYWALAEMVRTRADIVEAEEPDVARTKLTDALVPYVADAEERAWIEPRLAHLLGLEERTATDKEDLFAAWRLYFERLSEHQPAILVFEDMQWADSSLLEFIEYLLEWSRNHPIFVLTLARPELSDRHPAWGAGRRNFTALALEPLAPAAMERLLDGVAPGLPRELRTRILERAEGVPLYAVETVRMLLDRGLVERVGDQFRATGEIPALDVPETLHGLVAARLDGLTADERRLVQDAAVLGKTFTKHALAALSGRPEPEVEGLLQGLVRKEVLSIEADPRSPERGQYGFLQDLLRHVAYETLAKGERKRRHLAVAAVLQDAFASAEHEVAEVVASHYLEAYRCAPEADDAPEIRRTAREHLTRAGERAASLAASEEAQRYFEEAAELADDELTEAELLERAGRMALARGHTTAAIAAYERTLALYEKAHETHAAARAAARLGEAEWIAGELERAIGRMEASFAILVDEQPDADVAVLAAELGRLHYFEGDTETAAERIESALDIAETLRLPEVISQALNTKSLILLSRRPEEALALLKHALDVALEHDLTGAALRAYTNLSYLVSNQDRLDEGTAYLERGLSLAQARGYRAQGWRLLGNLVGALESAGDWDAALERAAELPDEARAYTQSSVIISLARILTSRGEVAAARAVLDSAPAAARDGAVTDVQVRRGFALARALVERAEGRYEDGLAAAEEAIELHRAAANPSGLTEAFVEGVESAFALRRLEAVDEFFSGVESLAPGQGSRSLDAQRRRLGARLAAMRGAREQAEQGFKRAAAAFRELALPFWLAVTLLEHGEWLVAEGRQDEAQPFVTEAREIFERLDAVPWIERATSAAAAEVVA